MPWYEPRLPMDGPALGHSRSSPDSAAANGIPQRVLKPPHQPESNVVPPVLVGERDHRLYVFKAPQIDYLEADGNYVKLHVDAVEYISRNSIKRLSVELANSGFVRIERSLLVNVQAIAYAQRTSRGRYAFTLVSGACVHSGAKYRGEILRVLPLTQGAGSRSSAVR
jgi:DNA-binding LytR/AlgR family response regulator